MVTADHRRRAYAAMRQWGDLDRDDSILEGACEARHLDAAEIERAAFHLAVLEDFRAEPIVADFLPALLAESVGGAENLAMEYGITIPISATARRDVRRHAIRSLAKAC
jgi:hypothetical protein